MINRNYCNRFLKRKIDYDTRVWLFDKLKSNSNNQEEISQSIEDLKNLTKEIIIKSNNLEEKYELFLKSGRIATYFGKTNWKYSIGVTVVNQNNSKDIFYCTFREGDLPEFRENNKRDESDYLICLDNIDKGLSIKFMNLVNRLEVLEDRSSEFIKWDWADKLDPDFLNSDKITSSHFIEGFNYEDLLVLCEEWFDLVVEKNNFSKEVLYGSSKSERDRKHKEILDKLRAELGD